MNNVEKFVERWTERGDEKSDCQTFWIDLLTNVFGVKNIAQFIFFEQRVQLEHKSFIDAKIPATHTMIEQKSLGKDLSKPIKQSDGTFLTPYQQAKRYANELPYSERPRWIVACNFSEFHVYDMEKPHDEPEIIFLKNLPKEFNRLKFLVDSREYNLQRELEISLQAGEIVQKLYAALRKNYLNPDSAESLQSLNKLCVRLVFCLYAESTGFFGDKKIFRDYLNQFPAKNLRANLIRLFKILDTKISDRDPYLEEDLKNFPYVNGNLFSEEIEIPNFNDEMKFFLLNYASRNFDWSGISPTIFGAVFESTLNPITRREGGMHYTSVENIHKVIDPLFLDNLREEFISCKKNRKKLLALQEKISQLKFFDPACGSGNFLTESYISLRKLENEILKELLREKILLGDFENPVKVSINQFFGIEINDFACAVAKTALWIAELQMLEKTQEIIHKNLEPFPLKNFANIFEGNALDLDWQKICPEADFIFGNPPFVGRTYRTREQVADIAKFFSYKDVDYVACWYKKAADFLKNKIYTLKNEVYTLSSKIECAFVSTNSITQGEQVAAIWENLGVVINFAYRTFAWKSESTDMAHVHCVIISFANFSRAQKIIFDGDKKIFAKNINPYLLDAPNYFIKPRNKTLQKFIPPMFFGNMAADNKNFSLTEAEKNILLKKFPQAEKFIKILIGGREFLHNEKRFCLWLVGANPSEIKKIPPIYERIKKVREFRLKSSFKKIADRPHEFRDLKNPKNFIAIPRHSSGKRNYIPMDFLDENFIASDAIQIIPDADLFLFGILQSSVHMIFVKTFCGRLKSDFNYSKQIVYNNFPFPEVGAEMREKISKSAEKILEVRAKYLGVRNEGLGTSKSNPSPLTPSPCLADLYDENLMPKDLRDAHRKNDENILCAYGFKNLSDAEILSELITLHKNLTSAE